MYVNANNARDSSLLVSKILVKFNWDHPQEGRRMQMIFPVKFFQDTDYSLFTVSRAGTASVTVCLGFSHSGTPTPFSLTPSQRTAACLLQYLSLCLASYVRWQRGTIRIRLPQAAQLCAMQQLIDIFCWPGPQQQTYSSEFDAVDAVGFPG